MTTITLAAPGYYMPYIFCLTLGFRCRITHM
uniref:Uncharacterized protein n=1 Tax=Anguilla anguilla TaxID=7936 RepID=A0A0E9VN99_ANGAN